MMSRKPKTYRVMVCRDDDYTGEPLFPPGAVYEHEFVRQGMADRWFENGTVFCDEQGTYWMVYTLGGDYHLHLAYWDAEARAYLLHEEEDVPELVRLDLGREPR